MFEIKRACHSAVRLRTISGADSLQNADGETLQVAALRGSLTKAWARARLVQGRGGNDMAKLALIYGMRLLPEEDLSEVRDATVMLKNGRSARVTMHLIEGSKEEIEKTFHQSIEAFFEMYPEI